MYIISIKVKKDDQIKWLFAGRDSMTGYPVWVDVDCSCDVKTFSDIALASSWFDNASSFLKDDLRNYKDYGFAVEKSTLAIRKITYRSEKYISFK